MQHYGESNQHKQEVLKFLKELTNQGWKTINLKGKSPDGIALKDNEVVAVELLLISNGGKAHSTISSKKSDYFMFDDVFIKKVERDINEDDRHRV